MSAAYNHCGGVGGFVESVNRAVVINQNPREHRGRLLEMGLMSERASWCASRAWRRWDQSARLHLSLRNHERSSLGALPGCHRRHHPGTRQAKDHAVPCVTDCARRSGNYPGVTVSGKKAAVGAPAAASIQSPRSAAATYSLSPQSSMPDCARCHSSSNYRVRRPMLCGRRRRYSNLKSNIYSRRRVSN